MTIMTFSRLSSFLLTSILALVGAWGAPSVLAWNARVDSPAQSRRDALSSASKATKAAALLMFHTYPLSASAADSKPAEFVNVGQQAPPPDGSQPFVTLENGVQVKDFKIGSGDSVKPTSRVDIQLNGRLLNLNGVMFYSTKKNNPDGFGAIPLILDLGKGQAVPGLEAGLVGMKKGGIRRIIVPQELAYNGFPNLEPVPTSAIDQRALESVVKNARRDATILFDVQLERVK